MNEYSIRAIYDEHFVRVYQAFNHSIADEAITLGGFGKLFNMKRMTWIKPSFLWMMYRCGWATKENQERVLAINIKREGFDYIVNNAVSSKYDSYKYKTCNEWKSALKNSDIRYQWDPERDIEGNCIDYRSIQLGIKGEAVSKYVNDWIVSIEDITEYVKELKCKKDKGINIINYLPNERLYCRK